MDFEEWKLEAKRGIENFDDFEIVADFDAIEQRDTYPTVHEVFLRAAFVQQIEVLLRRIPEGVVGRILDLRTDELFANHEFSRCRDGEDVTRFGGNYRQHLWKYFELPRRDVVKKIDTRMTLGYLEEECMRWFDTQKKKIRKYLTKPAPPKKEKPRNDRWGFDNKVRKYVRNRSRGLRRLFQYDMKDLLTTANLKKFLRPYIKRSKKERITTNRKYLCDILASLFLQRPSNSERRLIEKAHIEEISKDPIEYSFLLLFTGRENQIYIPKDIMLIIFQFLPMDRSTLDSVALVNTQFYLTVLESWGKLYESSEFQFDNDNTAIEVPLYLFRKLSRIKFGVDNSNRWGGYRPPKKGLCVEDRKFVLVHGVSLKSLNFRNVNDFSVFFGSSSRTTRAKREKTKNSSIESIKLRIKTRRWRPKLGLRRRQLTNCDFSCLPNLQRIEIFIPEAGDLFNSRSFDQLAWKDKGGFFAFVSKLRKFNSVKFVDFIDVNQHMASNLSQRIGREYFECVREGVVVQSGGKKNESPPYSISFKRKKKYVQSAERGFSMRSSGRERRSRSGRRRREDTASRNAAPDQYDERLLAMLQHMNRARRFGEGSRDSDGEGCQVQ